MMYKLQEGKLITPQKVWKGIVGYDKNLDLLVRDGWKPMIETGEGELVQYIEKEDHIEKHYYNPPYDYRAEREKLYPSLGDMIDAICKAYDGYPDELQTLMAQRQIIKDTVKKQ